MGTGTKHDSPKAARAFFSLRAKAELRDVWMAVVQDAPLPFGWWCWCSGRGSSSFSHVFSLEMRIIGKWNIPCHGIFQKIFLVTEMVGRHMFRGT